MVMQAATNLLLHQELSADVLCGLIANILIEKKWLLTSAESCTGGLISAVCTDLSGSSKWFERGFVTYSNAAKTALLGVDAALIAQYGAVSEPVVRAMASGALAHSQAQVAVAVTGIAGPTGGSIDKPVGTVWLGWATPVGVYSQRHLLAGDRAAVRAASVHQALAHVLQQLTKDAAC